MAGNGVDAVILDEIDADLECTEGLGVPSPSPLRVPSQVVAARTPRSPSTLLSQSPPAWWVSIAPIAHASPRRKALNCLLIVPARPEVSTPAGDGKGLTA